MSGAAPSAPLRVVFFGTPDFAVASLEALLAEPSCTVVGVVTAPDRPAGRGQQLAESAVKLSALRHQLPISQPEKLKDERFVAALAAMRPDLNVVVAFRMLPEVVWALPPRGSINLHASLLPDYRGAAPIHWAVMNGERATGLSTFQLAHEIDTGGILLQVTVPIPVGATTGQLYPTMQAEGAALLARTVRGLAQGALQPQPQDPAAYRHPAPKLTPENTRVDWARPAPALGHFIRGLAPQPAAWTTLGGRQLKLLNAALDTSPPPGAPAAAAPGALVAGASQLWVAAGPGPEGAPTWLQPTELQLEGRKRLEVSDFVRGMPGLSGQQLA